MKQKFQVKINTNFKQIKIFDIINNKQLLYLNNLYIIQFYNVLFKFSLENNYFFILNISSASDSFRINEEFKKATEFIETQLELQQNGQQQQKEENQQKRLLSSESCQEQQQQQLDNSQNIQEPINSQSEITLMQNKVQSLDKSTEIEEDSCYNQILQQTQQQPSKMAVQDQQWSYSDSYTYTTENESSNKIDNTIVVIKQKVCYYFLYLYQYFSGVAYMVYYSPYQLDDQTESLATQNSSTMQTKQQEQQIPEDDLTYQNITSCLKPKSGTFKKLKQDEVLQLGFNAMLQDNIVATYEQKRQDIVLCNRINLNRPLIFLLSLTIYIPIIYVQRISKLIYSLRLYHIIMHIAMWLFIVMSVLMQFLLALINKYNQNQNEEAEYTRIGKTGVYIDIKRVIFAFTGVYLPVILFTIDWIYFMSIYEYEYFVSDFKIRQKFFKISLIDEDSSSLDSFEELENQIKNTSTERVKLLATRIRQQDKNFKGDKSVVDFVNDIDLNTTSNDDITAQVDTIIKQSKQHDYQQKLKQQQLADMNKQQQDKQQSTISPADAALSILQANYEIKMKQQQTQQQQKEFDELKLKQEKQFQTKLQELNEEIQKYKQMQQNLNKQQKDFDQQKLKFQKEIQQNKQDFEEYKKQSEEQLQKTRKQQELIRKTRQEKENQILIMQKQINEQQKAQDQSTQDYKQQIKQLQIQNNNYKNKIDELVKQANLYETNVQLQENNIQNYQQTISQQQKRIGELEYQLKKLQQKYDDSLQQVQQYKQKIQLYEDQNKKQQILYKDNENEQNNDSSLYREEFSQDNDDTIMPFDEKMKSIFKNLPFYNPQELYQQFNEDLEQNVTKSQQIQENTHNDKVEQKFASGAKLQRFNNGTTKLIMKNGITDIRFDNGDLKRTTADHLVYFFCEVGTLFTQYTERNEVIKIYRFNNGQYEKHYTDGRKEVYFTDGSVKHVTPNKTKQISL